jgi:hypothetical protein
MIYLAQGHIEYYPLPLRGIPLKGESFSMLKIKINRFMKTNPPLGGQGGKFITISDL